MWLPLSSRSRRGGVPQHGVRDRFDPGPGGIDQYPRGHDVTFAVGVEDKAPDVGALGAYTTRARADRRAPFRGVDRVEHDKPRVVSETVRVFVSVVEAALERLSGSVGNEIKRTRTGQDLAAADQIVDQKTEPKDERRAACGGVERQHKTERPDKVRRHAQQHFTLAKRGTHEAERAVLQIAQPAVNQLRRSRRGAGGKVVLLDENDLESAPRGIAGNAGAVNAAADNGEIEIGHTSSPGLALPFDSPIGKVANQLYPRAGKESQ